MDTHLHTSALSSLVNRGMAYLPNCHSPLLADTATRLGEIVLNAVQISRHNQLETASPSRSSSWILSAAYSHETKKYGMYSIECKQERDWARFAASLKIDCTVLCSKWERQDKIMHEKDSIKGERKNMSYQHKVEQEEDDWLGRTPIDEYMQRERKFFCSYCQYQGIHL